MAASGEAPAGRASKTRSSGWWSAWPPRTGIGLTRFLVLFFIDLASRRVEIGGVARPANGLWVSQVARNLRDAEEGFLTGKRYLIHDRDPLFTAEFQEILKSSGVQSLKVPPCSPNLNAYAERFVRTSRNLASSGSSCSKKDRCGRPSRNSWSIIIGSATTKDWATG